MTLTMMQQYFQWKREYSKKYQNVLILLMCGGFMEVYSTNLDEIQQISQRLNIAYTKRNKNEELSETNTFLCGFPNNSMQKHVQILQKHYTVVIVEQDPIDVKKRQVTQIISPGTIVDSSNKAHDITTYLTQLYIEIINKNVICGVSQIDVKSGQVIVQEVQSSDYSLFMDEIKKILSKNVSSEIIINIINYKKLDLNNEQNQYFSKQRFLSQLHIDQVLCHFYLNEENQGLSSISRQNDLFRQIYLNIGIDKTQLQPIEFLDLEKLHYGAKSLAYLLFFTLDHNQRLTTYLKKPVIQRNIEYLQLEQNTIDQIDLFTKKKIGKISSVFDCVCMCRTAIGKRYLRHQLSNPICDINELNLRYDIIEDIDKLGQEDIQQLNRQLSNIIDIQLLQRKINLKMIVPQEFDSLYKSYSCIYSCLDLLINSQSSVIKSKILKEKLQQQLENIIGDIEKTLDLEKIIMCTSIKFDKIENFFKEGQITDQSSQVIKKYQSQLNEICEYYNELYEKQTSICQKNPPNKLSLVDGNYWISTTKNKFDNIIKAIPDDDKKQLVIRYLQNQTRYSTPQMFQISASLLENKSDLTEQIREHYLQFLEYLSKKWSQFFDDITALVQTIDVALSGYKLKHNHAYTRPNLKQTENSYIDAKELRHPIVESLDSNELFTPNNFKLDHNEMGNIILGINGSGKSVLLKSVSIAIILAQSGLFVPCKQFDLGIYHSILTQIDSKDNVFQQKSSFIQQALQIRNILNRAGPKSLVICDELLSTTNALDAAALFSATIKQLINKNTQFIFSTHLENLDSLDMIKQQTNVKFKHLCIKINEDQSFVYERKLINGIGPQNYGLNVAKTLGFQEGFINDAYSVQQQLLGTQTKKIFDSNPKKSRYNRKVSVDKCAICGKIRQNDNELFLEVHHIAQQKDADQNKMINHFHKNNKANLTILCHQDHELLHQGKLFIYGYKQTSNGIELQYERKIV